MPFVTPRQLNQIIGVRMAYYLRRNEVELSRKASAKAKQYINEKIQSLGIMDILKIIWRSLTSHKHATDQQNQDFNTYSSMLDEGFQVHFRDHQT